MEIVQELFPGVFVLKANKFEDRRGVLSVPFSADQFKVLTGVPFTVSQTMYSISSKRVLRGLHYQDNQAPVAKLISCLGGVVYDVIVDMRIRSQSFGSWAAIELSPDNGYQVYAPAGTAHGYLSLTEDSKVFYYQDGNYSPEASRILAWDDPDLDIKWPVNNGEAILSERDQFRGHSWQSYANAPIF